MCVVCVCECVRDRKKRVWLLEGKISWRSIGKAREGAGRLSDTAGHVQVVSVEQGGGHRQVGELGIKVPKVSWTSH